jgi:GTP-binding protein
VDIRDVEYRSSALNAKDRPKEYFPHIAIAGRSNVGKSSLINWLFRRTIARVAKAPGKTRTLNFFLVNKNFYLVDLPGYGYAKVSKTLRDQWGQELGAYLADEERIAGVVTLIDIRHGPTALDLDLQHILENYDRRRIPILTKADKVSRGQKSAMQQRVRKELGLPYLPPAVSVKTGEGRNELLSSFQQLTDEWNSNRTS